MKLTKTSCTQNDTYEIIYNPKSNALSNDICFLIGAIAFAGLNVAIMYFLK